MCLGQKYFEFTTNLKLTFVVRFFDLTSGAENFGRQHPLIRFTVVRVTTVDVVGLGLQVIEAVEQYLLERVLFNDCVLKMKIQQ